MPKFSISEWFYNVININYIFSLPKFVGNNNGNSGAHMYIELSVKNEDCEVI